MKKINNIKLNRTRLTILSCLLLVAGLNLHASVIPAIPTTVAVTPPPAHATKLTIVPTLSVGGRASDVTQIETTPGVIATSVTEGVATIPTTRVVAPVIAERLITAEHPVAAAPEATLPVVPTSIPLAVPTAETLPVPTVTVPRPVPTMAESLSATQAVTVPASPATEALPVAPSVMVSGAVSRGVEATQLLPTGSAPGVSVPAATAAEPLVTAPATVMGETALPEAGEAQIEQISSQRKPSGIKPKKVKPVPEHEKRAKLPLEKADKEIKVMTKKTDEEPEFTPVGLEL